MEIVNTRPARKDEGKIDGMVVEASQKDREQKIKNFDAKERE